MLPKKKAVSLILLLALLFLNTEASVLANSNDDNGRGSLSRFYVKKDRPASGQIIRRSGETASTRRESSFDPDVLNRFLEEYATKLKRTTTEKPFFNLEANSRLHQDNQDLEAVAVEAADDNATSPIGFRDLVKLSFFFFAYNKCLLF